MVDDNPAVLWMNWTLWMGELCSECEIITCKWNAVQSEYLMVIFSLVGELWDVFWEFNVWAIFYLCHLCTVYCIRYCVRMGRDISTDDCIMIVILQAITTMIYHLCEAILYLDSIVDDLWKLYMWFNNLFHSKIARVSWNFIAVGRLTDPPITKKPVGCRPPDLFWAFRNKLLNESNVIYVAFNSCDVICSQHCSHDGCWCWKNIYSITIGTQFFTIIGPLLWNGIVPKLRHVICNHHDDYENIPDRYSIARTWGCDMSFCEFKALALSLTFAIRLLYTILCYE